MMKGGIAGLMKQAQQMQENMRKAQEQLAQVKVLDPFLGSGTVGFVALMQDRKYIGIELNEEYCKLARKRISEEVEKIDKEKEYEVCKE